MSHSRLHFLFDLYLAKQANDLEQIELWELLADPANEAEAKELMDEAWAEFEAAEPVFTPLASKRIFNHILASRSEEPIQEVETESAVPKRPIKWSLIFKVAAICLMISTVGLLFFRKNETPNRKQSVIENVAQTEQPSVAPGGNKAILTLTDGTVIALDDLSNGEIANNSGISVSKTSDGELVYKIENTAAALANKKRGIIEYNTISTPRGGQYQINLPGGSKVWLNSESSLKFPTVLLDEALKVELKGEAYFEVKSRVSHDVRLAFIVITEAEDGRKQEVEVLGTHFNINSYSNESSIKTTLLEGSVRVTNLNSNKVNLLSPGQQSIASKKGTQVQKVDLEEVMAWKKGNFMFNDLSLVEIMRQLERWYDVDVNYAHIPDTHYHGFISKQVTLSQVLEMLELTGDLKFKITNSTSGAKGKIEIIKK